MQRRYFHLIMVFLLGTSMDGLGQRAFSFGIGSGAINMIVRDEAQPSFNFEGYGVPFRMEVGLSGTWSHSIQILLAKPKLSSPITVTSNGAKDKYMEGQLYSLRYGTLRGVRDFRNFELSLGGALHSTALLKSFFAAGLSQTSYEGIVRLAGRAAITRQYSTKGRMQLDLVAPFCSYLVHRSYALGLQEQLAAGFWDLYGVEIDINNHFAVTRRTSLVCGYNMLFYESIIGSKVTTFAQQLYVGFAFNF